MSENINFDTTLGNFVAMYPKTRKVFERFGFDYCCGGNVGIKEAANNKGVDISELMTALETAINETREEDEVKIWINEPLTDIVDHIMTKHHTFMWKELPITDALLDRVVRAHSAKHGEFLVSLQKIYKELKADLEHHLKDEEDILFPFIKKFEATINEGSSYKDSARFKEIVDTLCKEHDDAGAALSQMRSLTSNYVLPSDVCASFESLYENLQAIEDDLHEHVHLENTVLFPRVKELIK